ncbi:MAG: flagellar basal body rod protein FlgB [Deltaproteobacteria bacterium]|jgi:flagellar basal-body rod protein FlgB|nr:flagellar basal body rod protein FlgB [Deltaproteobacteria bacterium]
MPEIEKSAVVLLEQAMRFRAARQAVLSSNVANADTPGYRRVELEFKNQLDEAAHRLARTDASHLGPAGGGPAGDYTLRVGPRGTRPDKNGVELDAELVALNRNAGAFQDQAAVLARLHVLRRIAVTGEAR